MLTAGLLIATGRSGTLGALLHIHSAAPLLTAAMALAVGAAALRHARRAEPLPLAHVDPGERRF